MGQPTSRGLRQSYVETNERITSVIPDIAEAVRALKCILDLAILFMYVIE